MPKSDIKPLSTPFISLIFSKKDLASNLFDFVLLTNNSAESDDLLARGQVVFVVTIPSNFSKKLARGETPKILIEADAVDPVAVSSALGETRTIVSRVLRRDAVGMMPNLLIEKPAFELLIHRKYNPEQLSSYNIVPGLLGVILSMTLLLMTSIALTRELERGTMENLLALPARPAEIMFGKILPYAFVGMVQTTVILIVARLLFEVPFEGSFILLLLGIQIFIAANLCLGFTFSTIARSQMQAMQLTLFYYLPSLLLSGFMFPFRGMPQWAQYLGEMFPLTHYIRFVRGVMLKDASFVQVQNEILAILVFIAATFFVAMSRYHHTLD